MSTGTNAALPINRYERDVLAYLTRYPGVTDAHFVGGGNHRGLRFTADGKSCRLTMNSHDSGESAINLKLQDVRRLLGAPPPDETERDHRSLDELTGELVTKAEKLSSPSTKTTDAAEVISDVAPSWRGSVALLTSQLVLTIPTDLAEVFGDGPCTVTRITDDYYRVAHTDKGARFSVSSSRSKKLQIKPGDFLAARGGEPFGSTPADVTLSGGVLRFRLSEEPRGIDLKKSHKMMPAPVPVPVAPVKTEEVRVVEKQAGSDGVIDHVIAARQALQLIAQVEAETVYRLTRVTPKDGEPRWAFVAPRIEL